MTPGAASPDNWKHERARRFLYNLALWILIAVTLFLVIDTLDGKFPEDQICSELCSEKGFPVGLYMKPQKELPERCLCRDEIKPEKKTGIPQKIRSLTLDFPRP